MQKMDRYDFDGVVEKNIRAIVQLPCWPTDRYDKFLSTGLGLATIAYAHTSIDVQVQIAIFTMLMVSLDDHEMLVPFDAVEQFVPRFISGSPQLVHVLDLLAENLRGMPNYYPPYAANGIVSATFDFISAVLFERQHGDFQVKEGAVKLHHLCSQQGRRPASLCVHDMGQIQFSRHPAVYSGVSVSVRSHA